MTFLYPAILLLLLPVAIRFLMDLKRRDRDALVFSSLQTPAALAPTLRQRLLWLPSFLTFLSMSFVVLALARPQAKHERKELPREGVAMQLLVDISSSMEISMDYKDAQLTRLDITRKVVEDFVQGGTNSLP